MTNTVINRIFSSRLFYIIFALLASIALWMFVEIYENSTRQVPVNDIEVVFLNKELLRDRNFVLSSENQPTIDLTFECSLSMSTKLTNKTLSATIDLSVITSTGVKQIVYDIVFPPGVDPNELTIASRSVESIAVIVDRLYKKPIPVRGVYNGGTASGEYLADDPIFDPMTVTVYGPEAEVSKIESAWVPIISENLSSTFISDLEFVLLDDNGEQLDDDKIRSFEFSQDTIRVTIPISMIKEIVLDVEMLTGAGAARANTRVSITPSIITVSGDPEIIKDYNTIMLGTIDLTMFDLTYAETFSISIPNGFINQSGETEALVTVEVLGLEIGYHSVSNLFIINEPAGLDASFVTESVDVRLRGELADLNAITPMNIRIVADIKDLGPGTSRVPAKIYLDGDVGDVGVVGVYRVTVKLERESP